MPDLKNVSPAPIGVECIIPILNVRDLRVSMDFYISQLGFQLDWKTAQLASVSRDGRPIMLCQNGQGNPGTWIWIGVTDIEPLFAECVAKKLNIRQQPINHRWAYEMRIEDPDGHVLRFGSESRTDRPVV